MPESDLESALHSPCTQELRLGYGEQHKNLIDLYAEKEHAVRRRELSDGEMSSLM